MKREETTQIPSTQFFVSSCTSCPPVLAEYQMTHFSKVIGLISKQLVEAPQNSDQPSSRSNRIAYCMIFLLNNIPDDDLVWSVTVVLFFAVSFSRNKFSVLLQALLANSKLRSEFFWHRSLKKQQFSPYH